MLHEGSLLPAFRVSTPGLVSTATLPSVIRGGCYSDKSTNNNNDDDDDHHDNDTDDENDDNNDNDNDNNNKVARASAAARGVSFILGGFFGLHQENLIFGEVFVNNTMCRCFRFPTFFVLVFWWRFCESVANTMLFVLCFKFNFSVIFEVFVWKTAKTRGFCMVDVWKAKQQVS